MEYATGENDRREAVLTAVNESVIVLLEGLGSVSFPLENESGDTF